MHEQVTPESLRAHAEWLDDNKVCLAPDVLRNWAGRLESEQRPLPTEPGWYPNIVVQRGWESCTGAMLDDGGTWHTPSIVGTFYSHHISGQGLTIRWAEQDGTTPRVWSKGAERPLWVDRVMDESGDVWTRDHCDACTSPAASYAGEFTSTKILNGYAPLTEAEAAWARTKREPRVWERGDPEPDGVKSVRDIDGDVWVKSTSGSWESDGMLRRWVLLIRAYGPLTEVLSPEPINVVVDGNASIGRCSRED